MQRRQRNHRRALATGLAAASRCTGLDCTGMYPPAFQVQVATACHFLILTSKVMAAGPAALEWGNGSGPFGRQRRQGSSGGSGRAVASSCGGLPGARASFAGPPEPPGGTMDRRSLRLLWMGFAASL